MSDAWTTHYSGVIEGRAVEVKTYSEGGYRVRTTLDKDEDIHVESDASSITIISPRPKGSPIDIDGDTVNEIRLELAREGFNDASIDNIVGRFP